MDDGDDLRQQLLALAARVQALETALARISASAAKNPVAPARNAPNPSPPGVPGLSSEPCPPAAQDSLESRIGSQLFNRIGIFAVLIGMAWFLKLAIDRNWIGPGIRIAIGMVVAAALVVWSERFRARGYSAFSYTLKALGTGIAYLSLWASFSVYHLLPAALAFLLMVAVTVANAAFAWRQDSELLAVYALAGGLATPALLSTGHNHQLFLFSYLLLLDLGAAVLVAHRPWGRMLLGSFLGTAAYFGLWWGEYYSPAAFDLTAAFIALFYLLFTLAPQLILRRVDRGSMVPAEAQVLVALPLVTSACTFFAAYDLVDSPGTTALKPWVAVVLALGSLSIYAWKQAASLRLAASHLAIAVALFAIAAVLRFDGYGITLCWLAETLLLSVFASRSRSAPLRISAAVMLCAVTLNLLLLELLDPPHAPVAFLLNPHFATYAAGLGVLASVARLAWSALPQSLGVRVALQLRSVSFGDWAFLAGWSIIAFNLVALVAGTVEIRNYWPDGRFGTLLQLPAHVEFSLSAWYMFYGALLMAVGFLRRVAFLRWQALVLLALSIAKAFLFDTSRLSQGYRVLSFLGLGVLLLAVSFAYQRDWLALRDPARR
jgi:uncharacterized membrane protein